MTAPPSDTRVRPATEENIREAARILRSGGLVAFPTETVYGLGADACNDAAVARVFEAKGRPRFNPLIVHVPRPGDAGELVVFDERASRAAEAFWPGPLTMVLRRTAHCPVSLLASAGLDTLAIRVPASPVAREFLAATARPVVAPSANRSTAVSPTTAEHVLQSLGSAVDLILDGGPCEVGIESTVIDLTADPPLLLRPGGLERSAIEGVLGDLESPGRMNETELRSPGMLARHYAPERPIRLEALEVREDEALLAFGPEPLPGAAITRNLSETADLREAAANLFRMMRELDDPRVRSIAVMPIPRHGLGEAINDRLRRAATPG